MLFSSPQVLSENTCRASLPMDSVHLSGLGQRGASWDTQLGALQETVCLQKCLLPLACVKARISPCEGSHKNEGNNVQVTQLLQRLTHSYHSVSVCSMWIESRRGETREWRVLTLCLLFPFMPSYILHLNLPLKQL